MLGARRARRWPMLGQEEDSPPSGRAFALPARSSVRARRRRLVWLWCLAAPAPRAQSCFARVDSMTLRCAPCRGFRFCCGGPCALPLCRPPLDRTCTICPCAGAPQRETAKCERILLVRCLTRCARENFRGTFWEMRMFVFLLLIPCGIEIKPNSETELFHYVSLYGVRIEIKPNSETEFFSGVSSQQ